MRIVAGAARGRRIRSPRGEGTRPTSDRVREALFNALTSRTTVSGARVADLFAGSGALGIEALSRGAAHCWFVEDDRAALAAVEENLGVLGFDGRATIVRGRVEAVSGRLPADLDLVLADPPYAYDGWTDLLGALAAHLAEDAIVVAESDRVVELPPGWEILWERTYGGTVIVFTAPAAGTGVHA
jgi:16S rRNA (guanine966-N2)-methyltransferase